MAIDFGRYRDDFGKLAAYQCQVLVFASPLDKFSMTEFDQLKVYLENGGSILYLSQEGGERQSGSNFNYLLEEFGIMVNHGSWLFLVHFDF